ncbi:asparaginase domain-containing protein [Halarcobacter anaerophilus]|jgi:L-asparaginase|uniref:Asparaginase n=1 Tax=Halarcobacter anaerophilus TaxID=877500 RepID=A0A4Q0Y028_9BACT|nr:asparaginase domain-containing protein [Halarcobacter anaerophilus]QDF28533.1 asparaginase [Halarcobacter anaerophilus]RXJ63262.1 asparaginase [Halarcobacter anaerophilus]
MNVTIINTGGTFNKRYNPIKGQLEVPKDNKALEKIIAACHNVDFELINVVSKDSLEMNDEDRQIIVQSVKNTKNDKIIIIHGTDTVHLTSALLKEEVKNKKIVFTGAMVPMSIDEVEATMNFSQALGFLSANIQNGTYISMHGVVVDCSKLVKNRELGQFLIQE